MKRYLTQNELKQLLFTAKKNSDPLAQRDYHIMAALEKSGCRIQEFSLIKIGDVFQALKTGYLFIPKENRKKQTSDHSVYLTKELRKHLYALVMIADGDDPQAPLVLGRNGQHLSVRSYQDRIKYWAIEAGLSAKISPHWLRHTRAMEILRNSNSKEPLRVIKAALGHNSINSTMEYLKMSKEEYETALTDTDGLAGRRKNMQQVRREYDRLV